MSTWIEDSAGHLTANIDGRTCLVWTSTSRPGRWCYSTGGLGAGVVDHLVEAQRACEATASQARPAIPKRPAVMSTSLSFGIERSQRRDAQLRAQRHPNLEAPIERLTIMNGEPNV